MTDTTIKENIKSYYINSDKVLKACFNYEQIQENKKKYFNNSLFSAIYNHIMEVIPDDTSIELLTNINYHSIIWEFLRMYGSNDTNALYQDFKNMLLEGISWNFTSKLNYLQAFNNVIYLLIQA